MVTEQSPYPKHKFGFNFYTSLLKQLVEDGDAVVVDVEELHAGLVAQLGIGIAVDHLAHRQHLVAGLAQLHLEGDRAVLRQADPAVGLQADAAVRQVQRLDLVAGFIGHGHRRGLAHRAAGGSVFVGHGAVLNL